ncbi:hypothetical protein [uncultured Thiodictyon sp.]|uniref:hypothetical protein n=1 Tax=uncultured Thiodictyon sp. TaxID=1846217 RepID=UPI0025F53D66|nr:hypothetical protein [uncultured Thiodictyon sp.]
MSPFPLSYRVVGEDDYMLEIGVDTAGAFVVNRGDHTSHKPRHGQLSRQQQDDLSAVLRDLGEPRERPAPAGASGFMAELTLGEGGEAQVYRFWEGALDEDPALKAAVRELALF